MGLAAGRRRLGRAGRPVCKQCRASSLCSRTLLDNLGCPGLGGLFCSGSFSLAPALHSFSPFSLCLCRSCSLCSGLFCGFSLCYGLRKALRLLGLGPGSSLGFFFVLTLASLALASLALASLLLGRTFGPTSTTWFIPTTPLPTAATACTSRTIPTFAASLPT